MNTPLPTRQPNNFLRPFQTQWNGEDDVRFTEVSRADWLTWMQSNWEQGQHISIMGRTGRGKTMLAKDLLTCRTYVCALAVKRADDTLELFPQAGYKILVNKKWPPPYGTSRVVYWAKPRNLSDVVRQRKTIQTILDDAYQHGGWTIFFDDVAHTARALGFGKTIATLFNQARSSHSSQVAAMTQPSSITQAIPSEVWRQARFHLIFYYRTGRDLDVISDITGYKLTQLKQWMHQLRPYDFICCDDLTDQVFLVRS
jgi:hypothetical protein